MSFDANAIWRRINNNRSTDGWTAVVSIGIHNLRISCSYSCVITYAEPQMMKTHWHENAPSCNYLNDRRKKFCAWVKITYRTHESHHRNIGRSTSRREFMWDELLHQMQHDITGNIRHETSIQFVLFGISRDGAKPSSIRQAEGLCMGVQQKRGHMWQQIKPHQNPQHLHQ